MLKAILDSELDRIRGGNFLSPTCDEAKRSAAASRTSGDALQGRLDRGEITHGLGWLARWNLSRTRYNEQTSNRRAGLVCGR